MLSIIRKHWGKFALALTSFFWTACGSNSDSGNNGECPVCEYGVLVDYSSSSAELSSSSVESSSSDIPMSQPLYGVPVATDCYTTTIKSTTGSSYNIFECDNGNRYLKDYFAYSEHLKESLPDDILWNSPNRDNGEGVNCNFNGPHLCVDKMDDEGNMYGGCVPTIECPYKPDTTTYNCYSTTIKNKDNIDIDIVECEDGHKWTREQARFSICTPDSIAIPEDVTVGFPAPGGKYAKNCKLGPNTCIISECTNKEYCAPTIECPYKSE